MRRCCPLGIDIDSPASGGISPPHVIGEEYRLTYLNTKPLVETNPDPG